MESDSQRYNPEEERTPKTRLIVVNGDVCTGSSTLARTISVRLGISVVDAGTIYRNEVEKNPDLPSAELSARINFMIEEMMRSGQGSVIEGRLVGIQAQAYEDVLRILTIADLEVLVRRYSLREGIPNLSDAFEALSSRWEQDDRILRDAWDISRREAFDRDLYDLVIDTSYTTPEEICEDLIVPKYFNPGHS